MRRCRKKAARARFVERRAQHLWEQIHHELPIVAVQLPLRLDVRHRRARAPRRGERQWPPRRRAGARPAPARSPDRRSATPSLPFGTQRDGSCSSFGQGKTRSGSVPRESSDGEGRREWIEGGFSPMGTEMIRDHPVGSPPSSRPPTRPSAARCSGWLVRTLLATCGQEAVGALSSGCSSGGDPSHADRFERPHRSSSRRAGCPRGRVAPAARRARGRRVRPLRGRVAGHAGEAAA